MTQPVNGEKSNMLSLYLSNQDKGVVKTVFRHSFNVALPQILLHVGNAGDSLSCLGLTLPDEVMDQLITKVDVGNLVRAVHENLYVYTEREIVTINLAALATVDLQIPRVVVSPTDLTTVVQHLQAVSFTENWGLRDVTTPDKLVAQLMSSRTVTEMTEIATYLYGRGRGLTPSGDDILVGFLSVLQAVDAPILLQWQNVVSEVMTTRTTTDVSAAYLKATLAGYTSARVKALLTCIDTQELTQLPALIDAIQHFGHTSGTDLLLGIATGFRRYQQLSMGDKKA